jgi:hypothetical protein
VDKEDDEDLEEQDAMGMRYHNMLTDTTDPPSEDTCPSSPPDPDECIPAPTGSTVIEYEDQDLAESYDEEACRLLDQLVVWERQFMHPLMHTVLPMTMRRVVAVRREVYSLQTTPGMTLDTAVDSLIALFGGLNQMVAGRDVMTEELVALKDKWLAQGPLFLW